mmetsp:Transcript_28727/g.68561  ORF Transcript_28727/g.68561 Transcript_28727/m.68561 type:complete len:312 (+) Transcript_28727:629-1564(+)
MLHGSNQLPNLDVLPGCPSQQGLPPEPPLDCGRKGIQGLRRRIAPFQAFKVEHYGALTPPDACAVGPEDRPGGSEPQLLRPLQLLAPPQRAQAARPPAPHALHSKARAAELPALLPKPLRAPPRKPAPRSRLDPRCRRIQGCCSLRRGPPQLKGGPPGEPRLALPPGRLDLARSGAPPPKTPPPPALYGFAGPAPPPKAELLHRLLAELREDAHPLRRQPSGRLLRLARGVPLAPALPPAGVPPRDAAGARPAAELRGCGEVGDRRCRARALAGSGGGRRKPACREEGAAGGRTACSAEVEVDPSQVPAVT